MRDPNAFNEQARGMAQLVMAMILAGSSVVVGKFLTAGLPVFMIGSSTLLVAFLVLLPPALLRWHEIRGLTPEQWASLFMQALCGIVLFRVLTLYGLQHTGAVQAGVILGTTPAVLTLCAVLFLGERPTPYGLLGVGFAVCGMMVLNLSSGPSGGKGHLWGSLLVFGAVVAEALFTIFRKKVAHEISAVTNTFGLVLISLMMMCPFVAWEFRVYHLLPGVQAFTAIVYYGVCATAMAYLLWTHGVGRVSAEAAGAATAAMPASSVLLAALVLGEPLDHRHLLGCSMVMAGIAFSTLFKKRGYVGCVE